MVSNRSEETDSTTEASADSQLTLEHPPGQVRSITMTQSTGLKHKVTTNNNLMFSNLSRRSQTHFKRVHKQMSTSPNKQLIWWSPACLQGHRRTSNVYTSKCLQVPTKDMWWSPTCLQGHKQRWLTADSDQVETQSHNKGCIWRSPTCLQGHKQRRLTAETLITTTVYRTVSNLSTRTDTRTFTSRRQTSGWTPSGPPLREKHPPANSTPLKQHNNLNHRHYRLFNSLRSWTLKNKIISLRHIPCSANVSTWSLVRTWNPTWRGQISQW